MDQHSERIQFESLPTTTNKGSRSFNHSVNILLPFAVYSTHVKWNRDMKTVPQGPWFTWYKSGWMRSLSVETVDGLGINTSLVVESTQPRRNA
jgi:hypothetical protein